MNYTDRCYWNARTYGKAFRITRTRLLALFIILCIITPATNWMIPFAGKIIKTGITLRYGQ